MLEPPLDATEVRVLGSLIEKQFSTPDYYPMTVNALTQACNQKTNREPVVDFSERQVQEALSALQRKRLVGTASGAVSRVLKYRHALAEVLDLATPELAVLSVLLLRGPQTVGEIRGRTGRLHAFDSLDEVDQVVQALSTHATPLVTELERQPGQKEARHAHLLAGEPEAGTTPSAPPASSGRLDDLEDELQRLRDEVDALRNAFEAFRAQFE
jgi:uncharacterized protein YceH (UPF0502 family)